MAQNQLGNMVTGFVDKRRSGGGKAAADSFNHQSTGVIGFTCNGAGSTSTLVGAVAVLNTGVNVMRLGDTFRLFATGATVPKEETVFTVTAIGATGTPVTFTPLAAVATASGDVARLTDNDPFDSEAGLDARLFALNPTSYTAARLTQMTQNDKHYALRVENEGTSL